MDGRVIGVWCLLTHAMPSHRSLPSSTGGCLSGDYAGVFDPLDGSSNIEAGLPVGTIFGIYRRPTLSLSPEPDPLEAIMQPGSELLASGA